MSQNDGKPCVANYKLSFCLISMKLGTDVHLGVQMCKTHFSTVPESILPWTHGIGILWAKIATNLASRTPPPVHVEPTRSERRLRDPFGVRP